MARTMVFNLGNSFAAGVGGIIVARALGPGGRGEYATLVSWLAIALILGELGQTAAVVYFGARDSRSAPAILATAARLMMWTGAVAVMAMTAVAFSHSFGSTGFWSYLILAAILPLSFVSAPYVFMLQAIEISTWNWVRSVQPVIWLGLLAIAALVRDLTVPAALLLMLVSISVQAAIAWIVSVRRGLGGGAVRPDLRRPMVTYGLSNLASVLPTSLTRQLDVILLSFLTAASQVGFYSVAMSYTMLATPIAAAIGSVLFPAQARSGARSLVQVRRYLMWTVATVVLAAGPLIGVSSWLLTRMYGEAYGSAVPLVLLLVPALLSLAVNQVGGDLLRGQGRPRAVAVASWTGLVVLMGLMSLLVPAHGVAGACVAVSLSQSAGCAATVFFLYRTNRAPSGTAI